MNNTITSRSHLPVGMFDSGVGGLTVLKALRERMPCEEILYLGDTARLPYGTKSPQTVTRYALQATARLVGRGVKMLVIACNTASAVAVEAVQQAYPDLPVIGVVRPGAQAACRASEKGVIAVIATEGTIAGGAYHRAIHALRPEAHIIGKPTPLFVPLAEEGWVEGEITEAVIGRYLRPVFEPASGSDVPHIPDTLVLGCTHFPLLAGAIRNVVGPEVNIVDSAATTADAILDELSGSGQANGHDGCGGTTFLTTDDPAKFARTGTMFLGTPISEQAVELVDL